MSLALTERGPMGRLRARLAVRSNRARALSTMLFFIDLAGITIASLVAAGLRDRLQIFRPTADVAVNVGQVAIILAAAWMGCLMLGGAHRAGHTGMGTREYTVVATWSLVAAGIIAIALYLTSYDLSRGFYVLVFTVGIPLLIADRYVVRRIVHRLRSRGHLRSSVLVAGHPGHVDRLTATLDRERWLGYEVVGALTHDEVCTETPGGLDILGRPGDALEVLKSVGAHGVIFAEGSFSQATGFNELARDFEDEDAQLIVVPTLTDISAGRVNVRPLAGIPLVFVEQPRAIKAGSWGKRVFDLVGATVLIVLSTPLMAAVALAIKLEDGGPVLFRQRRTGLKGVEFDCLKFRSMVVDAESRLRELESQNQASGVLFKIKDDPRITRVGGFIRRYSLDELPQFFNVWTGKMSLVGPRPALPREVARYSKLVMRRLDVRPGITGLWQVSGRSDLPWDETVRLDLYYVDNWTMLQDLNIIGRTTGAILRSRGAY